HQLPLSHSKNPVYRRPLVDSPKWRDPIMSARLLTVFILPTLLLAVALAPGRAAQQPAEPAKPAKAGENSKVTLVTKVYQVTDLVIPLLPCEPASKGDTKGCATRKTGSTPSPLTTYRASIGEPCPEGVCESDPKVTRESDLIHLIHCKVQPTEWNDVGGPYT